MRKCTTFQSLASATKLNRNLKMQCTCRCTRKMDETHVHKWKIPQFNPNYIYIYKLSVGKKLSI